MRTSSSFSHLRWKALGLAGLLASGLCQSEGQILPPAPEPSSPSQKLAAEPRIFVKQFHFEGNTAYTDAELASLTAPYTNREISTDDLEQARRAISVHYVNNGYVNSGAVLPDQNPADGTVTIRIIEGSLSSMEIRGNKWLRNSYLRGRIRRWTETPLNLNRVREGLQLLRQNPNIRQINAELKPGEKAGDGVLDVRVADQQPFRVGVQVDNQRPPSVGAEEIWLLASDLNVTGHSDIFDFRYGIANNGSDGFGFSGADNFAASYVTPITPFDTTLGLHGSKLNTSLVEEPFTQLDIESETITYGFLVRHPLYQSASQEFAIGAGFDRRENSTTLLHERFNISPGAIDGEMAASIVRLSQEWVQRGQNHLLALRSTLNFGVDAFNVTDNRVGGDPDAKFFSWLGQGQYVQRLFNTQNQMILRLSGQWSSEPLLALEQFSVGGSESVRGYRENQLVRDRGILSSIEFRLPVLFNKAGAGTVFLAPFFDFGGAWNVRGSQGTTTIESTGIGLVLQPNRHIYAHLFWGHRLRDVPKPDKEDPQDIGLHFRVNIEVF